MTDLSFAEYREGCLALEREIGPKANIYTSLSDRGKFVSGSIYPYGMGGPTRNEDGYLRLEADTLRELLDALRSKWAEYEESHRTRTIRKMSLAIIRITAELGECTDAALRNCGEFDPGQIKRYGEQACADANDIAGRGPFKIITMGGANAEAAA